MAVSAPVSTPTSTRDFVQTAQYLQSLVKNADPSAAFTQLALLAAHDPKIAIDCHELTHEIGDAAYDKYGSFKAAFIYNDYMCGSGYIHSLVVNTFLNTTDPSTIINSICDGQDGYCFHGIGHGLMFFTHNDVPKAIEYCDELRTPEQKNRCSEGVFMQNFQPGQDDPTPYVYPNDPLKVCRDQSTYKTACYLYAGEYLAAHWDKISPLFDMCTASEAKYVTRCDSGIGAYLMALHIRDAKQAEAVCNTAPSVAITHACIDGMVSYHLVDYSSISKTQAMCDSLLTANQATCNASLNIRRRFYQ